MPISNAQITTAEVVIVGSMDSGGVNIVPTINILHFRRIVTTPEADKIALEAAFGSAFLSPIKACLNNRWTWTHTRVRWMNDVEDPYREFEVGTVGTVAGDSLPSDKCVFLLKRTGVRGKAFRGSMFLGPVSEADTTAQGDVLNAAALARFRSVADLLDQSITDSEGNIWDPSLLVRKISQLKTNPTTVETRKITQVLVNQRISSQKRRRTASKY